MWRETRLISQMPYILYRRKKNIRYEEIERKRGGGSERVRGREVEKRGKMRGERCEGKEERWKERKGNGKIRWEWRSRGRTVPCAAAHWKSASNTKQSSDLFIRFIREKQFKVVPLQSETLVHPVQQVLFWKTNQKQRNPPFYKVFPSWPSTSAKAMKKGAFRDSRGQCSCVLGSCRNQSKEVE